MSNYVQFVVCQYDGESKKHLFYAPAFSDLKKGDEVLLDTQYGKQKATRKATVCAVCTFYDSGTDVEKALRVLAGAEDKPLKRVIGKYQFVKFDYNEDKNNG